MSVKQFSVAEVCEPEWAGGLFADGLLLAEVKSIQGEIFL